MEKQPKLQVILSDLHCGSDVGLLPEKVELDDGQTLGHGKNAWQAWLWQEFKAGLKWVDGIVGKQQFGLTLTGDLIEGIHHRSDEVVAMKLMEHLAIARASVGSLIHRAVHTDIIRGTECHTHDFETVFAKEFGIGKAHDFVQRDFNGVLMDARHHMPCTSRKHLESSALGIISTNNVANAVRAGHRPARIFLRGHRHVHGIYSDGDCLVCVTGAWQGLTRHGRKVVADSIPRPSIIVLDARNTKHGELPAVHQKVFNPPQNLVCHVIDS